MIKLPYGRGEILFFLNIQAIIVCVQYIPNIPTWDMYTIIYTEIMINYHM